MGTRFASGKHSIAVCDVCGGKFKLKELRAVVVRTKKTNTLACPSCWSPDHPQLKLGMKPVLDPQAVRNPRPDTSYQVSADNGPGSRVFQWGWNPVGGSPTIIGTPNNLSLRTAIGTVSVE